jgi:hypothetical protein
MLNSSCWVNLEPIAAYGANEVAYSQPAAEMKNAKNLKQKTPFRTVS